MRSPSDLVLLDVWDAAPSEGVTSRALRLLGAALPEQRLGRLADRPIGRRDSDLLDLREQVFGDTLECALPCPACHEPLEFQVPLAQLRRTVADDGPELGSIAQDGYEVTFRLPNSRDLRAIENLDDQTQARMTLLERCVILATCVDGSAVAVTDLPEAVSAAVGERMAELDPMAVAELRLDCSECACVWQAPIDPARFLLSEVDAWARRMLHEVHQLARSYGWSEAQIVELSPRRRQYYLELSGA
jgi:hypothetical protein